MKTKTIKAWAILGKGDEIAAIALGRTKPQRYYIGSWVGFVTKDDKLIPVTISYQLTKKR